MKRSAWTWKTGDPDVDAQLHLKYESGNWGDVLKGAWLTPLAREVARSRAGETVRYLDPFAGAPEYPLLPATAERVKVLPDGEHAGLLRPFVERGRWPSCALLAREQLRAHGASPALLVFDAHDRARAHWSKEAATEVLELASGHDAFAKPMRKKLDPHLALVDCYDFFDRWGKLLEPLAALGRKIPVLVYLFNKAPRGEGFASQYARFRKALAQTAAGLGPVPLGRLPYDAIAPKDYHEVFALAPREVSRRLIPEWEAASRELAHRHADVGAFELVAD